MLALIGVALIAPWDRTGVAMEDIVLRHNLSANSRQRDRGAPHADCVVGPRAPLQQARRL